MVLHGKELRQRPGLTHGLPRSLTPHLGLALPLLILLLLIPTRGLSLLLFSAYAFQGWRMYRRYLSRGLPPSDASIATRFILLGKFAEVIGIARYCLNRLRGRYHIIEHK